MLLVPTARCTSSRAAPRPRSRVTVGLTEAEVAAALEVTDRTVRRDWEKARPLLAEALA